MKLEHSEKPAEIRPRVISLTGNVPRIELFARHRVKGWDAYGDQLEDGEN
jgi:N6-adenosine-specific RNA methylase IME4